MFYAWIISQLVHWLFYAHWSKNKRWLNRQFSVSMTSPYTTNMQSMNFLLKINSWFDFLRHCLNRRFLGFLSRSCCFFPIFLHSNFKFWTQPIPQKSIEKFHKKYCCRMWKKKSFDIFKLLCIFQICLTSNNYNLCARSVVLKIGILAIWKLFIHI